LYNLALEGVEVDFFLLPLGRVFVHEDRRRRLHVAVYQIHLLFIVLIDRFCSLNIIILKLLILQLSVMTSKLDTIDYICIRVGAFS
jgi:hypothetical protein